MTISLLEASSAYRDLERTTRRLHMLTYTSNTLPCNRDYLVCVQSIKSRLYSCLYSLEEIFDRVQDSRALQSSDDTIEQTISHLQTEWSTLKEASRTLSETVDNLMLTKYPIVLESTSLIYPQTFLV